MSLLTLALLPVFIQAPSIEAQFAEIERASKGRLGAAVITPQGSHYSRRQERFSLQSVMKLMASMAALDRVDQGTWKIDQKYTVTRADMSISYQPLLDRLGKKRSITVTLDDLIVLAVTESCSASADFIIRKLGGPGAVNAFLKKNGISGMSVDRQERDLQTDVVGLKWKPAFIDDAAFEAAIRRQSASRLDAAYKRYMNDPRDTTTPEAMGLLLKKLVTGKLLSPKSNRYLIGVMERTKTGSDRLRSGIPSGWKLGNKTGTSSTHRGIAWATNDVGFARRTTGEWVVIVALLKGSPLKPEGRADALRQVAAAAFLAW